MTIERNTIDSGFIDYGFTDLKGRACGYRWNITEVTYDRPMAYGDGRRYEAGDRIIEMWAGPTRDGHHYGPSNRVRLNTIEQARQLAVKRAAGSRKRDTKKFAK